MSDRYTVINKEEPHGQSVAENGIPCTARHCVTQLNGLFQNGRIMSFTMLVFEVKKNILSNWRGVNGGEM